MCTVYGLKGPNTYRMAGTSVSVARRRWRMYAGWVCSRTQRTVASHSDKIALSGSRRLHSTLAATPIHFAHAVVTVAKHGTVHLPPRVCREPSCRASLRMCFLEILYFHPTCVHVLHVCSPFSLKFVFAATLSTDVAKAKSAAQRKSLLGSMTTVKDENLTVPCRAHL